MNGPADRSVRLLLLVSGSLLVSDSARIVADLGHRAEPIADLKVHVNSDPADRLRALPGIGPVIAERVIEQRSIRPFRDGDDFAHRVRGLGPSFTSNYGGWMDFGVTGSGSEVIQVDRP